MWSYIGTLFGYVYGLAISLFAYIDQKLVNKISAIKHQILLYQGYNILRWYYYLYSHLPFPLTLNIL